MRRQRLLLIGSAVISAEHGRLPRVAPTNRTAGRGIEFELVRCIDHSAHERPRRGRNPRATRNGPARSPAKLNRSSPEERMGSRIGRQDWRRLSDKADRFGDRRPERSRQPGPCRIVVTRRAPGWPPWAIPFGSGPGVRDQNGFELPGVSVSSNGPTGSIPAQFYLGSPTQIYLDANDLSGMIPLGHQTVAETP